MSSTTSSIAGRSAQSGGIIGQQASILVELTALGTILVAGADATKFLQGQLTNDVTLCTPEHAQLSAWCSPKGRVLMSFWMFQRAGGYCLLSPTSLDATLVARLRLFVLRAKVQIADETPELARLGIAGEQACTRLERHYRRLPHRVGDVVQYDDGLCILRTYGAVPRFELVGSVESVQQARQHLGDVAVHRDTAAWTHLDIESGLPLVRSEMTDEYLPQMLNLMELGAVNLNKGCYVGQEIVARAHYRGKLKRRLYAARANSSECPAPGTDICRGDRKAGKVLAAVAMPDGGCIIQAVLNIEDAESGVLALSGGRELELTSA